jgi:hypothetical protein
MDERQKEQTKRCPKCGEEILAVASKCKHCGSNLAMVEAGATASRAVRKYGKRVVGTLAAIGMVLALGLLQVKPRVVRYLAYREILAGVEELRGTCTKAADTAFEIWVPSMYAGFVAGAKGHYRTAKLDQEQLRACRAIANEAGKLVEDVYAGTVDPLWKEQAESLRALEWGGDPRQAEEGSRPFSAREQGRFLSGDIWYHQEGSDSPPRSAELVDAMRPMVEQQRKDLSGLLGDYTQRGDDIFQGGGSNGRKDK